MIYLLETIDGKRHAVKSTTLLRSQEIIRDKGYNINEITLIDTKPESTPTVWRKVVRRKKR